MIEPIVDRVLRSARYRDVDRATPRPAGRGGAAEVPERRRRRQAREAAPAPGGRRVPRRGAADPLATVRATWAGDSEDAAFRAACADLMRSHASTAERLPYLERFFAPIWEQTGGPPRTLLDLGCGLGPLALPWMGLPPGATYHACEVDRRSLEVVGAVPRAGRAAARAPRARPRRRRPAADRSDVALLLKLVPLLDRQDPSAAARLLGALDARHAVVTFPTSSLGGRRRGMEATYRRRLDELVADLAIGEVREASVPNELVFVLTLDG